MASAADNLWTLCLGTLPAVQPGTVWQSWSLAPEIVLPLAVFALVYGVGWVKSRSSTSEAAMSSGQAAFAAAGILLLVVALVSPLCRLSANLAWTHMVQHLLIVALAPPLVLLGAPERALLLAFGARISPRRLTQEPAPERRRVRQQLAAAFAYGAAIWIWHIPWFYEAALASASIHLVFVASLLVVSLWFWREVISAPAGALGTIGFVLLATLIHTGMLGALLTFSRQVWYSAMTPGALLWGLRPLEDQQLAGLIMWIPMGAIYLIAGLLVLSAHLGDDGQTIKPDATPLARME
jgi:cytochrome c oxidase assembly factor CtaG